MMKEKGRRLLTLVLLGAGLLGGGVWLTGRPRLLGADDCLNRDDRLCTETSVCSTWRGRTTCRTEYEYFPWKDSNPRTEKVLVKR